MSTLTRLGRKLAQLRRTTQARNVELPKKPEVTILLQSKHYVSAAMLSKVICWLLFKNNLERIPEHSEIMHKLETILIWEGEHWFLNYTQTWSDSLGCMPLAENLTKKHFPHLFI